MKQNLLLTLALVGAATFIVLECAGIKFLTAPPSHKTNPPVSTYDYSQDWEFRVTPTGQLLLVWVGYADVSLIASRGPHVDWALNFYAPGPWANQYASNVDPFSPIEPSVFRAWYPRRML